MKGREIILGEIAGRRAAALIVDGVLDDLIVDAAAPAVGTIYRATVDRPVKGQGGVFVTTPDGTGFLRQVKGLRAGERVLVQVSGFSEPGKAVPVTTRLLFKGRHAIVTPDAPGLNISRRIRDDDLRDRLQILAKAGMDGSPMGLILRSAAETAAPDEVTADIEAMRHVAEQVLADTGREQETLLDGDDAHTLAWRDWQADSCREGDLSDWIADAQRSDVALPGGGTLWLEPTRALVAVDVNTGRDTSPGAGIKANIAAAKALPRALRVRGLGGQVVLDLAPMPKKDRRAFETALKSALRADPVETTPLGWTPLGHYELTRKRARAPLAEVMA